MTTLALGMPQGMEWLALLLLGLLLFGRRLPEVGRSLGQGLVEFKRGLKGVSEEVEEESSKPARRPASPSLPEGAGPAAVQPPRAADGADARVSRADSVD
jgi:sec-independent protein translocase protein TatA